MPSMPSPTMVLWPQRRFVCASVCRSGVEAVGSALACHLPLIFQAWLFRPRSCVLAAALAEDGSRRSRPGAVSDYCFTVDGRRMLYDVKRISFCPSRYWRDVSSWEKVRDSCSFDGL